MRRRIERTSCGRAPAHSCHFFALRTMVAVLAGAGLISSATVGAQELATVGTPAAVTPAPAAQAGEQDNGDRAVVVVTGARQAAQSAQTIKRNAEQVLDSIVADDIGKFPDKNVAEILGRVPGVQVIRQNGEASSAWRCGGATRLSADG